MMRTQLVQATCTQLRRFLVDPQNSVRLDNDHFQGSDFRRFEKSALSCVLVSLWSWYELCDGRSIRHHLLFCPCWIMWLWFYEGTPACVHPSRDRSHSTIPAGTSRAPLTAKPLSHPSAVRPRTSILCHHLPLASSRQLFARPSGEADSGDL